ncbi:MAG: head maturation protease, ClpP-related [Cetobacterium sp.]|uniref:head maturation protease, ClpP-related n=1 Tax=Cetobacterium sp. TaxID=2071632 RepID=UPI003F2BD5B0
MSWWRAVKKKNNKAEILIFGEIGSSWWTPVNTREIREQLAGYDDVDEIVLRIDSPGGSVFAGIGLYSYLKDHKAKKKVYIDGMCASIATVIAMAGDEIFMNAGAQFMIHNPWTIAMGEAKELRHDAKVLDGIRDSILKIYETKTKLTKEQLIKAMDETTYYQAEQALEAGFITEITHMFDAKNCIANAESWDTTYSKYEKYINIIVPKTNDITKNNNDNKEKKMTLKELQDNHPDVYNEVLNLGKNEERNRMKALDGLADKVNENGKEILNKAKYENFETAEKIALNLAMEGGFNSAPQEQPHKNVFDPKRQDASALNGIHGEGDGTVQDNDDKLAKDIANYL